MLGRLADLKPHPTRVLETEDEPFAGVLNAVLQVGKATVRKLLQEDLTRLVALRRLFPELLDKLNEAAAGD